MPRTIATLPVAVSIVTPSFNQGAYIGRTLESVAAQASKNIVIDHVVFDGGSTDMTVEVLRSRGSAVRWMSERDRGQAHAVNKGLLATRGAIVGWLNSDDIYYPGAVEAVVRYFDDNPDLDVVYGQADHIGLDDKPFEEYPTEPWDFDRLKETCFICQPAVFFRRSALEKFGMLDESLQYCMDYELWLRWGRLGARFDYLRRKLAGSRLYADTKTLGARVRVHAEINDMFRREFGHVPDKWLLAYAHAFVQRRYGASVPPEHVVQQVAIRSVLAAARWNGRVPTRVWRLAREWLGLNRTRHFKDPQQVTREDVVGAYRVLLGRDPESEEAVLEHLAAPTLANLRERFMDSDEFRQQMTSASTPSSNLIARTPARRFWSRWLPR